MVAATVAMTIVSPATLVHLDLDFVRQEELAACARTLAMQCVTKDAASCALSALALCETSAAAFDSTYHIVAAAASRGAMTPTQLFAIARYLERRGHPRRAHRAALLAMRGLSVAAGQDAHPALADVRWACSLARSVGADELSSMLSALIENVHCATVLSDVLRRCAAPGEGKTGAAPLSYDRPPLASLLSAALAAYVSAAHARLAHISPRHYADFIEFLVQARDTFRLAADGPVRFAQLVDNMKLVYKGKKKLMLLITERFGP